MHTQCVGRVGNPIVCFFSPSFYPVGAAKQLLHFLWWQQAELVRDVWFRKGFIRLLQGGERHQMTCQWQWKRNINLLIIILHVTCSSFGDHFLSIFDRTMNHCLLFWINVSFRLQSLSTLYVQLSVSIICFELRWQNISFGCGDQICLAKANNAASLDTTVTQDLSLGDGQAVKNGDTIELLYTGWLMQNHTTGEVFDSNRNTGKLMRLKLGAGKAIKVSRGSV